jgi:hypothetical protein
LDRGARARLGRARILASVKNSARSTSAAS